MEWTILYVAGLALTALAITLSRVSNMVKTVSLAILGICLLAGVVVDIGYRFPDSPIVSIYTYLVLGCVFILLAIIIIEAIQFFSEVRWKV